MIKKGRIYLFLILLFYLICSFLLISPDFPIGGDNDELYLLGRSIANKHCYQDIYYHSCPPHAKQPFLYPLILALGQLLFGENVIFLRLISVFFGLGSLIFIYFFFKKKIIFSHLLFILFFTATNPWFLVSSVSFANEIVYLFFSFLVLVIFEKHEDQKKFLPMLIFFLISIFFTKCIGFSLVTAVFFYFIIKKRYKQAFLIMGLWSCFVLPWIVRNMVVSSSAISKSYMQQFSMGLSNNGYAHVMISMGKRIFSHIFFYWQAVPKLIFPGYFSGVAEFGFIKQRCFPMAYSLMNNTGLFLAPAPYPFFSFLISVVLGAILIIGMLFKINKKSNRLFSLYIFLYLAILLVFPEGYEDVRYLFPLVPFILYYMINGVLFFVSGKGRFFKLAGIILIILVHFYYNLIPITEIIYNNIAYLANYRNLSWEEKADYNDFWKGQCFIAAPWVEKNIPFNEVIVSAWPPAFYLYSKRQGDFFEYIPCWPDRRTPEEIKFAIEEGNAAYFVIRTQKEEKLLQKLDAECSNLIFVPLVIMFKPDAVFTKNIDRVYKIARVSSRIKVFFKKGIHYFEENNYSKAILEYKETIKVNPDFFDSYYRMGLCYEKEGLFKEACRLYEKAIELQPNYEMAKNRLNFLYQKELIKNNSNDAKEYLLFGNICLKNYDFVNAVNGFKKAIEINPDLPEVYYKLGIVYTYEQKFGLAILYFKKAMEINSCWANKAKHQIKVNRRRRIIEQYLKS